MKHINLSPDKRTDVPYQVKPLLVPRRSPEAPVAGACA
ncbi:hypothetical protein SCATT_52340 [Streptantibioticus cattleyicolor NRRL 8057 = DSM 46488]|uniref:Uncharacterized protein n=1 Tax=Streptantibioticus cattleyicolor (strain ATCC 35852 / DSM 46488 / JCM 4925 / NBRC 14057 / NRRL 8057) TaxID=1003195 RepID=G8X0X5_STREN|nr:hypothetical protein SCATT_52340 [Streptantibioticus cattleyicolor NRRL 8057 = DSM 46488]